MARKKHKAGKSPNIPAAQLSPAALRFALPVLVALFSLFAWSLRGGFEDAFFYLRVVDVFLHSGDLSYNPGERFETNTDFLWTLLLIPGPAAGLDDILWMHIVGALVYAAALWATFTLARKLFFSVEAGFIALVLLGGHFTFAYVAVTGLGAALQGLAAICCLLALLRFGESASARNGAILGFALLFLALCRLDSAVFGLPLVLCAIYFARKAGKSALPGLAAALGIPSVLFGGVLLWKLSYYGDIFPAPYYIKGAAVQAGHDQTEYFIRRGAAFLALYWHRYFLWLGAGMAALGAWLALRRKSKRRGPDAPPRRALLWTMGAMCVLWHGYMIRVGGDLYEFRMMVPQAAILALLASAGLRGLAQHWRWATTVAMTVFSFLHWQTNWIWPSVYPNHFPLPGLEQTVTYAEVTGGKKTGGFQFTGGGMVQVDTFRIPVAFWDLFGHLGKYHPDVRVARGGGGIAAYLAPLFWVEAFGYADPRIGRAAPEDVVYGAPYIGHSFYARPELYARLGVNLVAHAGCAVPDGDFSRPFDPSSSVNARLQWAMAASHGCKLVPSEFPPDSQLFALPLWDGQLAPILYFNRNQTIDRVLDERGIERVNVF